MTDDEEYEGQDERARAFANRQWKRALSNGQDIDPWIDRSRVREVEAAVNGRYSTARWWLVIGDTLSERQRDRDEALLYAISDIEWPDGTAELLDGDFGLDL